MTKSANLEADLATLLRRIYPNSEKWGDVLQKKKAETIAIHLEARPPRATEARSLLGALIQETLGPERAALISIENQLPNEHDDPALTRQDPQLPPHRETLLEECLREADLEEYLQNLVELPNHPAWISRSGTSGHGTARVVWHGTESRLLVLPNFELDAVSGTLGRIGVSIDERNTMHSEVRLEVAAARRRWLGLLLPTSTPRGTLLDSLFSKTAIQAEDSFQHLARALEHRFIGSFQPSSRPDLDANYLKPIRQALERCRMESRLQPMGRDLRASLFVQQLLLQGPTEIIEGFEDNLTQQHFSPAGSSIVHGCLGLESILLPDDKAAPITIVEHGTRFLGDYLFDVARLCTSLTTLGHAVRGGEAKEWFAKSPSRSGRQITFALRRTGEQSRATKAALACLERSADSLAIQLESADASPEEKRRNMRTRLLLAMARHFLVAVSFARSLEEASMLLGSGVLLLNYFEQGVRSRRPVLPSELMAAGLL